MIIDSSEVNAETPENFTVQLEEDISEKYSMICLKHVFIRHGSNMRELFQSHARIKPIFVHCNLLCKEDNIVNGKKSDVIGVIYHNDMKPRNIGNYQLPNNSFKFLKYDSKISLSLTTSDGESVAGRGRFAVVYELEFS